MCDHDPMQCIIPPHMLKVLQMRGDAKLAKMATEMLAQNEKVRDARQEFMSTRMVPDGSTPESAFLTPALSETCEQAVCKREIYDGQEKAGLPGKLARKEGDGEHSDATVNEAYDGAGAVFDLYAKEFGRDSLDGNGMKLVATVHHRRKYNNAFWNGEQMAYGDGDGVIFVKFTELSVIAHEMSHGVVQFSGGLRYTGQSGALNESFADCFGAMIQQYRLGQESCEGDWLIGKGILGPDIRGVALRSMKAPGTAYSDATLGQDPQPYHMDFYVDTTDDNGGVHINSGIPNHAFYLYCQYLGGNSWQKAGQVWYQALQRLNNPLATFHDWAAQTVDAALRLYGVGALEVNLLRRSWKLVGISI